MSTASDPLTKVIYIEAPPDYVFDFIAKPENMIRWIGVAALFEPREGGAVRIDANGRDVIVGKVLKVIRPSYICFTWGYEAADSRVPAGSTIVEITLVAVGQGTRLTLVHRELPDNVREGHDMGWTHYLVRLKILAQGGNPGADPLASPEVRHR